MKTLSPQAYHNAVDFLYRNARLIDLRRSEYLHRGGPSAPVLDVLRGYQNPDGGFAWALEPDLRGPTSQPQHAEIALHHLNEISSSDSTVLDGLTGWCDSHAIDKALPWVLDTITDQPHAPWWQPQTYSDGSLKASINPTGAVVGFLHALHHDSAWRASAEQYCWDYAEHGTVSDGYAAKCLLTFLEYVPDRERALRALERCIPEILATVSLDPHASGHVHFPLDLAGRPGTLAAGLFDTATIDRHLDVLVEAQQDDGGWPANFPMWTDAVRCEWAGFITLNTLTVLHNWGRIDDNDDKE
ncbi:hypothetical protein [Haloglycomyces albus]|uniref:hypothetical protein n=1 Tax=Haloglycomyces albus TaxID=526067 RepID=UPI00046D8D70|nr:hypothetical protein [Haloglycomyces albus]